MVVHRFGEDPRLSDGLDREHGGAPTRGFSWLKHLDVLEKHLRIFRCLLSTSRGVVGAAEVRSSSTEAEWEFKIFSGVLVPRSKGAMTE